jgi:hypothetical protein
MLLKAKVDTEVADKQGKTPLFIAISKGNYEATETLLMHRADINTHDLSTQSALTQAVKIGRQDIVNLILTKYKPIDINRVDNEDGTSLHYAVMRSHTTIMKMLLTHGAKPELANKKGKTCISYAEEFNLPESLKTIRKWLKDKKFPAIPEADPKTRQLTPTRKQSPPHGQEPVKSILRGENSPPPQPEPIETMSEQWQAAFKTASQNTQTSQQTQQTPSEPESQPGTSTGGETHPSKRPIIVTISEESSSDDTPPKRTPKKKQRRQPENSSSSSSN